LDQPGHQDIDTHTMDDKKMKVGTTRDPCP
jgi:hypothetical protein